MIEKPAAIKSRISKIGFVVLFALIAGILMSLFSTSMKMVLEHKFLPDLFYSDGAIGMFLGGFLGGLIPGTLLRDKFYE